MNLERDGIREFLEKRHKELQEEEYLPKLNKDQTKDQAKESEKAVVIKLKSKPRKILLSVIILILVLGLAPLFSRGF